MGICATGATGWLRTGDCGGDGAWSRWRPPAPEERDEDQRRNREAHQPELQGPRHALLAFERALIDAVPPHATPASDLTGGRREPTVCSIDPHLLRVIARRPARRSPGVPVVAFQRLEHANRDLRGGGDLAQ
jgi:hypothetical protein